MSYTAINPETGEIVRDFPTATDQEVKQALEAGSAFYESQKSVSVEKRAELLLKLADVMDENVEELAREAAENMGKLCVKVAEKSDFVPVFCDITEQRASS